MASNSFPIDPLQTQLVSPTTNVTAPSVAGPQPTGLSEGLRTFSKALGSAAEYAKARRFEEDKIKAGLYAAMGDVAPGLVSQEALLHNYNLLDENFVNKTLKQVEVFNDNGAQEIAAHPSLTKDEKARHFATFLSNIKDKARGTVLHNGEALSKLNVALDGYKYKWNHDIAQATQLQNIQTTTQAVIGRTEEYVDNKGNYDIPFIKNISETIRKADLTPPFEMIGGVKYKTYPKLDADKTAYVIASDTAIKYLGTRPELYRQLLELRKTYFNKQAATEAALLASGKTLLIGDDKSFATLFKTTDDQATAYFKKEDADNKIVNETAFSMWLSGKLARGEAWQAIDSHTLFNQWGHQASTYIKKAKTVLEAAKHGENSKIFRDLINEIATNPNMSTQYIERQIIGNTEDKVFGLTPGAGSLAKRILTENKTVIRTNITSLKDASPFLTYSKIYDAIKHDKLKESFLTELNRRGKTLEAGLTKQWLESWLKEKSTIRYSKQIRTYMTKALEIFHRSRSAITDLSVDRTLQRGQFSNKEQFPGKEFSQDDIKGITTGLLKEFLEGPNGLNNIANITYEEIIALEEKEASQKFKPGFFETKKPKK